MAEQVSRQAAKVAAGTKMSPNEAYGKVRVITITTPATVTWANGDTIASPVVLPVGTRLLLGSYVSNSAMGASAVMNVGLRDLAGVAISATAIASAIDMSAAARTLLANGAYVAAGIEYVTTVPSVVYATFSGATPTANAQVHIDVFVATAD
jgi:hypothetical protein